ncbi:MAG: rRNA (uracil1498-N3)-methyltransferase [Blastocatellia bacterium]|jgi:16S rRNA (uracil1498-N3)-methyltransferase|nr:rRNA (uracil1498-N3)-methyltransferase [Blastocatellia bacterium]
MTRRRFYAPPEAFNSDVTTAVLAGDEARHLRDVLRLAAGDEVFLFDGAGSEYRCVVSDVERASSTVNVIEEVAPACSESPLKLTLAVALLKGEKFDLVVQKATELGVTRIVPVKTTRADIRLPDNADAAKRVSRWQRIALEAAKQSGRAFVPQVTVPVNFLTLVSDKELQNARRVMFSERDGGKLSDLEDGAARELQDMIALVGSEGGWTDEEIAASVAANWNLVTLGGRTLRAETAAITAAALLQNRFGDLQ